MLSFLFSLICTFLMVFIPFWLLGKLLIFVGNRGQAWCQAEMERRGIPYEDEPATRRRRPTLRVVK